MTIYLSKCNKNKIIPNSPTRFIILVVLGPDRNFILFSANIHHRTGHVAREIIETLSDQTQHLQSNKLLWCHI